MSRFFDKFPTIAYDINRGEYTTYQAATDIFMRIAMVKETLDNISAYYIYDIREGDTPERLADQIYKTPEAHWVIMLANDIHDGHYDWPLNYDEFNKYVANKYRTAAGGNTLSDTQVISWAQTETAGGNNIYKYEKVIERTDSATNITTTWRYEVNYNKVTLAVPTDVPYDYYTNLSTSGTFSTYEVNGSTIHEKVYGTYQTIYEHEIELNEAKRQIKIIKPDYYNRIAGELTRLTKANTNMIRRLI